MTPFAVPIVLFIMIGVTAVGMPIAKAYARRMEREDDRGRPIDGDVAARLERIEQAIDSIAIEVERISEGQRFTTKLLADRNATDKPSS